MEERPIKTLYKIELLLLKIIPFVLSVLFFSNTILSYFGFDTTVLSVIAGVGVVPLLFLYISSYVFKFCEYHRMFLHYIAINDIITYYDYYIGIPISNKELLTLNIVLYFITILITLYIYVRTNRRPYS